jgi:hypothetical protein
MNPEQFANSCGHKSVFFHIWALHVLRHKLSFLVCETWLYHPIQKWNFIYKTLTLLFMLLQFVCIWATKNKLSWQTFHFNCTLNEIAASISLLSWFIPLQTLHCLGNMPSLQLTLMRNMPQLFLPQFWCQKLIYHFQHNPINALTAYKLVFKKTFWNSMVFT